MRRCAALYNKIPALIQSGKLGEISVINSHYYSNMTPNGIGNMKPEMPTEGFRLECMVRSEGIPRLPIQYCTLYVPLVERLFFADSQ